MLRQIGITPAYHTHDLDLRAGAREIYHVLRKIYPMNVTF